MHTIYLDNNATTPPPPAVRDAMLDMLAEHWHNPSSVHRPGQQARHKLELARKQLAALIGARPRQITLTGSGTEALDLAIRGALLAQGRLGGARTRDPGAIITSKVEHVGVRDLAKALEKEEGIRVLWADLDTLGRVKPDSIRALLDANPDTALVSIQWANNETGVIHPVHEIAALCRAKGVLFHTDATQYVGKLPACVEGAEVSRCQGVKGRDNSALDTSAPRHLDTSLPCDLLTYSPHKFHGPKGVGILYSRPGVRTAPLIHGEQELGRRGGTENVPGIVGSGVAANLATQWLADPANIEHGRALRDRFERAIVEAIPESRVNAVPDGRAPWLSDPNTRLWNTSSIGFARLEAEAMLLLLSERGVCVSAGAACASGSLEPSPILKAMNVPSEYAHGTLRFSLSRETTNDDIDRAVPIIIDCVARLRQSMSAVNP